MSDHVSSLEVDPFSQIFEKSRYISNLKLVLVKQDTTNHMIETGNSALLLTEILKKGKTERNPAMLC